MADNDLTPAQIDLLSERGIKFLGATSQVPVIRALLDAGGYNAEEHAHGWALWLELAGYRDPVTGGPDTVRQRQAVAELDAFDGPSFDRARAALEHRFPAQANYVFQGLTAKSGMESVGAVRTFLDRVAALRDGTDSTREATRAEDAAAAQLLATRRIIDVEEEKRLRALIDEATQLADAPKPVLPDPAKRQQTARAFEAWLRDWRETARVLVTRRDYQIRLGLAERRAPAAAEAVVAEE